jgi:polysaccharide pyruvyl transferase WcaK-like protein
MENKGCEALAYSFAAELIDQMKELNRDLELSAIVFQRETRINLPGMNQKVECLAIRMKSPKFWTKCWRLMKESDVIIDFTMGDSFTDIYGIKRFLSTTMMKQFAIWSKKVFILGPQTFGPFQKKLSRWWAKRILNHTQYIFTRDVLSQEYVKKICGKDIVLTTDVAFSLPYSELKKSNDDYIHIGFNPSALLWAGGYNGKNQFGLSVDYQEYCNKLIETLSKNRRYKLHLIPHVWGECMENLENDLSTCNHLKETYPETVVVNNMNTSMDVKSYISSMDIFIGARMHATIAAFSSGVATIPFSYSRKFEGLYKSLNYPYVVSARVKTTQDAINETIEWIEQYQKLKVQVDKSLNIVHKKQEMFHFELQNILSSIET